MTSAATRILLIEDNEGDAFLIEEILTPDSSNSFTIDWRDNLAAGLTSLQSGAYDLILLDLSLPDSFGISTFTRIHTQYPQVPVIVLSHNDDEHVAMQTVQLGAQDYLEKGEIKRKSLTRSIRYALERHQAETALRLANDELARRQHEIEAANEQLRKLIRVKDEFLAKMSHELRTPLSAMLITTELLQMQVDDLLNEKQRGYLNTIYANGQHLLDLINDILDMTRLQARQIKPEVQKASIKEICESALSVVRPLSQAKKQTLTFELQPGLPSLVTDFRRLKQILINLLTNAIKFTPRDGQVGLIARQHETEETLQLIVWDKGIGMDPADVQRMFEPFVQLDNSPSRQYEGTGLGLTLVRQLCELLNGEIDVTTALGCGSTFTLTFALAEQPLLSTTPASG
ncbi:MAG: response regulator [Anaerolineales bacterium]|nr:response regulator [Anaerolineales bacterium]